jgi:hypothetical protein
MDASSFVNVTRRRTVSWAIRLLLSLPAAVTLAADPIVVSVTDSKPTGAIVQVHDDLPFDLPEPAAQSPMPSDIRQAVYWPDSLEPTAPREDLVNRTNDLMRRALRPLSPLNPWGNSAPSEPMERPGEPRLLEWQIDPRSEQPVVDESSSELVRADSTLVSEAAFRAPAAPLDRVPSISRSHRQSGVAARPSSGMITASRARFLRGADQRLTRTAAESPQSALGSTALPVMPRYVGVDELSAFLTPGR